jgi:hypothetical protein
LKEEVANDVNSKKLGELLTIRWFPAMNDIGEYAGLSDIEIDEMSDKVAAYITK